MFVREVPSSIVMLFAVGLHAQSVGGEPRTQPDSYTVQTFSRPALLRRFDADTNGKLNATEQNALRNAFGGIDVPMLPAAPYRYADNKTSTRSISFDLDELDNTPGDNPITNKGATLGRVLFYDRQLSRNNTIACASCHHQHNGFSDPERFSVGFKGDRTNRNSMGLVNLRYTILRGSRPGFFWDERATLEAQTLMPIQDQVEMGMELPDLEQKLSRLPYYAPLFQAAFGSGDVSSDRISKAIAQFLRSMKSFNSRFDRAAKASENTDYTEDFDAFSAEENYGKSLYINGVDGVAEIGCAHCHIPPTFGMPKAFNNGLALEYKDKGLGARNVPSNDVFTDDNNGKFKAPSLRNISLTAPYMHDGRFETLEQVIEHYSSGVYSHVNLGLAFKDGQSSGATTTSGFRLTAAQQSALVAFLKTLTDETIVADPRFSDPFIRKTIEVRVQKGRRR